jgi:hypothetical protein
VEATELIRLRTLLEFGIDGEDRLRPFPWADPTELPRLSVSRHPEGYVLFFSDDTPGRLRAEIGRLSVDRLFDDREAVLRLLGPERPCAGFTVTRSYYFARDPRPEEFAGVVRHESHFVVMEGGAPVAWAWTVREHARAEEVAVETVAAARRRGFGRRAAAAWVYHVLHAGKVPFLRHPEGDAGLAALARSLGGIWFSTTVEYR